MTKVLSMKYKQAVLWTLGMVFLIDAMGNGLVFPILPELLLDPSYGLVTTSTGSGGSAFWYGMTISIITLMAFIGMPVFGYLSDRYGRKHLLVMGLLGISIAYLMAVFAIDIGSLVLFLCSRALLGFCVGTYTVATAVVGDITKGVSDKMLGFRWLSFASLLGVIIGPLLGATSALFAGKQGVMLPFIAGALLTLINTAVVVFILKETHGSEMISDDKASSLSNAILSSIKEIFQLHYYYRWPRLIVSYLAYEFADTIFGQAITLYLAIHFHYSSPKLSLFLIVMAIVMAISTVFLQPWLLGRYRVAAIMRHGLRLLIMAFLLLIFLHALHHYSSHDAQAYLWLIAAVIFIIAEILDTAFDGIFSELAGDERQGEVMGMLGQLSALIACLSGLMVGFFVLGHWALMSGFAAMMMVVSLVAYFYYQRSDERVT